MLADHIFDHGGEHLEAIVTDDEPLDPAVHTETTCENGVCTIHVGARDTDEPLAFRISGQDDVI